MTTEEQAIGATCWENDTKAKILRPISISVNGHNIDFVAFSEFDSCVTYIWIVVVAWNIEQRKKSMGFWYHPITNLDILELD